jgi:hypothetical protein
MRGLKQHYVKVFFKDQVPTSHAFRKLLTMISTFNSLSIWFNIIPLASNSFPPYYTSPHIKHYSVINNGVEGDLHVLNNYDVPSFGTLRCFKKDALLELLESVLISRKIFDTSTETRSMLRHTAYTGIHPTCCFQDTYYACPVRYPALITNDACRRPMLNVEP